MAYLDIVEVKTNAGIVPAVVLEQRDVNGAVTATDGNVTHADLLLLGQANALRTLAKGTTANTFTFTGANS